MKAVEKADFGVFAFAPDDVIRMPSDLVGITSVEYRAGWAQDDAGPRLEPR